MLTVLLIPLSEGMKMFAALKFGVESRCTNLKHEIGTSLLEYKTKYAVLSILIHKNKKQLRFQLKFTKFVDSFGEEFTSL